MRQNILPFHATFGGTNRTALTQTDTMAKAGTGKGDRRQMPLTILADIHDKECAAQPAERTPNVEFSLDNPLPFGSDHP